LLAAGAVAGGVMGKTLVERWNDGDV
jgi:hypothetical protein